MTDQGGFDTGTGEGSPSGNIAIFPDSLTPVESGPVNRVGGSNGNELAIIEISRPINQPVEGFLDDKAEFDQI